MKFLDRIKSRKFIVFCIGVILFLVTDRFSADHMIWVFALYIGGNTVKHMSDGLSTRSNSTNKLPEEAE